MRLPIVLSVVAFCLLSVPGVYLFGGIYWIFLLPLIFMISYLFNRRKGESLSGLLLFLVIIPLLTTIRFYKPIAAFLMLKEDNSCIVLLFAAVSNSVAFYYIWSINKLLRDNYKEKYFGTYMNVRLSYLCLAVFPVFSIIWFGYLRGSIAESVSYRYIQSHIDFVYSLAITLSFIMGLVNLKLQKPNTISHSHNIGPSIISLDGLLHKYAIYYIVLVLIFVTERFYSKCDYYRLSITIAPFFFYIAYFRYLVHRYKKGSESGLGITEDRTSFGIAAFFGSIFIIIPIAIIMAIIDSTR